jgi:hypothetical protein
MGIGKTQAPPCARGVEPAGRFKSGQPFLQQQSPNAKGCDYQAALIVEAGFRRLPSPGF